MNNYSKTKSTFIYIIFGLLFAVGTIMAFIPMRFGSKDFESFFGALSLSSDCTDTISAIYKYTEDETTDVNKAIDLMGEMIESKYGKNSVNIYKLGDSKIRVDVSKPVTASEAEEVEEYLAGLASGKLKFTNNISGKANYEENPNLIEIDGWTDIESISAKTFKGSYGIEVAFTKSGKEDYSLMTGGNLYIYVNNEPFPSEDYNKVELSSETSTFTIWFSSSEYIDYYINTFEAGRIPIYLDADTIEFVNTEANVFPLAFVSIAITAIILALYIFAIVKYKLPAISYVGLSIISTYILIFLLQAMPWVEIGIISIISIGLMKVIELILFETMQRRVLAEYMLGKSIETSFDDAYKRTVSIVLDVLAICLLAGLTFAIAGRFELRTIGTIISLSTVLSGLVLLLGVGILNKCHFAFNQTKTSCYALPKRTEGEANE